MICFPCVHLRRSLIETLCDYVTVVHLSGKVIASTVAENAAMMEQMLGARPVAFKPSIPHLIYQYVALAHSRPRIAA